MTTSPRAASIWERLASPFAGVSAGGFAALSAVRRNRVFHPVGEAYSASVTINPLPNEPPVVHDLAGTYDNAIVRFSRGAGLPEPLPDILGVAVRIPLAPTDAQQDLLFASSGATVLMRHLLIPARSFFGCTYSTILPYRTDEGHLLFGARAAAPLRSRNGSFGDVTRAAHDDALRFDILVAEPTGPWRRLGTVEVGRQRAQGVAHGLRFNPWNSHPGLRPAGPLNELRRDTYVASQEARPTT